MKEPRSIAGKESSQEWVPLSVPILAHVEEVKYRFHLEFYSKRNGEPLSQLMRTLSDTGGVQKVADSVVNLANHEAGREDGRQGN